MFLLVTHVSVLNPFSLNVLTTLSISAFAISVYCIWATAATHAVFGSLKPGISLKGQGPGPVRLIDPFIGERRCSCLTVRKTASSLASLLLFWRSLTIPVAMYRWMDLPCW